MSKYQRLKGHLPSLYQPEEQDLNLLNGLLKALGQNMDQISRDLTDVMQSHWYRVSDKATYDQHFIRGRELAGLDLVDLQNPADKQAIADYPYLLDLVRIGSLVSVPPWREPLALRETVEEYRTRLLRIVNIYRNGLGTLGAIRDMVTAELPENDTLALPEQQRSFVIEETTPYIGSIKNIISVGASLGNPSLTEETIGPLMRWPLSNNGLKPVAPIIYITGVAATTDHDETTAPLIERFDPDTTLGDQSLAGIGIGYTETLPAGETLRLTPTHGAIIADGSGMQQSANGLTQYGIHDFQPIAAAPDGDITASLQTSDRIIWIALDNAGTYELWRYDGQSWERVLDGVTLSPINCLQQRQQELLIGSDDGLLVMDLFPNTGDDFTATAVAAFSSDPVYVMVANRVQPEHYYVGAASGLHLIDASNSISQTLLGGTPVRAIAEDSTSVFFGGDLGLFQYRFKTQSLGYLHAEFESEQVSDWLSFASDALPDNPNFGMPMVRSLLLASDGILWIGTEQGMARYRARKEADLVFRSVLEGYSDLVDGSVISIREDEHGVVWFATSQGLLRFDGRDLASFDFDNDHWQQLGQADSIYNDEKIPRSVWRFDRTLSQWQIFDYVAKQWVVYSEPVKLAANSISALLLIDTVNAELGTLSPENEFSKVSDVDSSQLRMRCKPDHTRIVDGGIPAVPRMPKGDSNWRYLNLEPAGLVDSTDLPWWSIEGRLVPPPEHNAPYPGRFQNLNLKPFQLDQMVFAYNPSAVVKFCWENNKPLRVLVRLLKRESSDSIDPAILDRVWQGVNRVKPAGVNVRLAVNEAIVRGEQV